MTMKIKAKLTIDREVDFCGVSRPHITAEIAGDVRVFDNRVAADRWLKDEATQIQQQKLQLEQERTK